MTITTAGGARIKLKQYYALSKKKKVGPKKKGRNGRGVYPLLSYWGFINTWSPSHWEEVTRAGVASASYQLAIEELKRQNVSVSLHKLQNIVSRVGEETLKVGSMLLIKNSRHHGENESFKGKRICITIDGGRIRSRQTKEGRPKKGHDKGYDSPWIEPKLLCIYELNEKGEKKKDANPIYYATVEGMEKLYHTLSQLSVCLNLIEAKEIVFIADGAEWIWNMFEQVIKELKLPKEKTYLIADYYHGVEHLSQIALLDSDKKPGEVVGWVKTLADHLLLGEFKKVEEIIDKEGNEQMKKEFNYFRKRRDKMDYALYQSKNLPIGSGAVESAVKRVINLRIKSTGSFWKKENVEKFLFLRCALISGRWDTFYHNLIDAIRLTYNIEEA